jgi:hypothetical protein
MRGDDEQVGKSARGVEDGMEDESKRAEEREERTRRQCQTRGAIGETQRRMGRR